MRLVPFKTADGRDVWINPDFITSVTAGIRPNGACLWDRTDDADGPWQVTDSVDEAVRRLTDDSEKPASRPAVVGALRMSVLSWSRIDEVIEYARREEIPLEDAVQAMVNRGLSHTHANPPLTDRRDGGNR